VELLASLYEQAGERAKLAALLYDTGGRVQDETQRFERLRRAGALALEAGDGSMAIMALGEALAVRPRDEAATLLLSDAYILSGALVEAAELVKPLIAERKGKASPALGALYARVARIAELSGDPRAELEALARALDADRKNAEIMAAVADRAEAAGDLDLALKALRLICANNTPGPMGLPEAFLRQARISHRRGEKDRALSFARRATVDAPKGDPVHRAARELIATIEAETR
jgi:tetratricopeptide (TPR) repeat protein